MYGTKSKIEADLISPLLASSCALTIGLNLNWWPLNKVEGQPPGRPNFTDEQLDNVVATMYLVAIGWSQWSGTYVGRVGPYALMAFGVSVSICGSLLASLFPCHVYCVYAVRVLQGFGCASLAVAVPEYIMMSNENVKDSYQSSMLCFIEVFIIVGEAISHALSILVTWTQMNFLTTGVISLNLLSLILLRMTSRRHDDRMMVCHYNHSSSSVGPYCELLRDTDQTVYQDEPVSSANTSYQFADDDKCYMQKFRYYIFVCLALFVFRDFSCVHVFKKSIRCIFAGLNVKYMTYEQWALLVTTLQLIFTASTVCMVEIYGRRKLLLISSLGMLLAATGLELFIFNIEAFTSKETRHVYIMAVLLIYIIFFAQGLSSTPWAMTFKIIHQNVRSFTLGFIISAHFLFLMIVEFSYFNEEHMYSEHSTAAYWLIIIYLLQTIFVYTFVMDTKS